MKKILVAIDSFKGCLSSKEAGEAAYEGIKCVYPDWNISVFPVADGGEGILERLVEMEKGKYLSTYAHDPLMRIQEVPYGISGDNQIALIEMAAVSGLTLLAPTERNPWETTSYGLGELIKNGLERGCRKFIIGIGGSATNDAGIGFLQALGFRFLDAVNKEVPFGGKAMEQVKRIDFSQVHPALKDSHFIIACDVDNPFYGPQGAAYVYAKQKGATPDMIERLDKGMQYFSKVIKESTGIDVSTYPGAGAAGGVGGAFRAFLNAEICSGIQLLLKAYHFDKAIEGADFIITGEGKIDKQTNHGKVPDGILEIGKKYTIPVIAIAGIVEDKEEVEKRGYYKVLQVSPADLPLEKLMEPAFAKQNISTTLRRFFECQV